MQLFSSPRARWILAVIAAFFGVGFLIYGWSLHNPFVRWDDGMLIYENPAIRQITPATLQWIFTHFDPELYIPLTFFSYQIDYLISGIHPFEYHLDNLVLHILNALLVAFILFALIRKQWIALFCGLLFLVHPLNTEGVEWASGRKDVLSTFFFLASIASYFLYRDRSSRGWYIASVLLFLCGLLSKVMIITLPVVLVILDYAEHRKFDRRFVLDKIPYLALSTIIGIIGIVGKQGVLASSSLSDKVWMAFVSIAFYVRQFFWPFHFSLLYPYDGAITITLPFFFVPMLLVLAVLIAAFFLRNRARLIAVGIAFYVITVIPTLLNFAKGEMDLYFASDRYAYVPQIGLLFVVASILLMLTAFFERTFDRQTVVRSGIASGGVLLVIISILAYRQSLVWQSTQTLFQNVIVQYPNASYVAYNNLCNAERLENHLDAAIADCQKSLAIRPHPKTYTNLGDIYRKQQQYHEALDTYQKGMTLNPQDPYPHFGLGLVYADMGQTDKAETEYMKALALQPVFPDVNVDLGALYASEGKYDDAIAQYKKALVIDSFNPTTLFNLAIAEGQTGKVDPAIADYERSIAADPMQVAPRINLGLLLYNVKGDRDGAVTQFLTVLKIDPQNSTARSAMAQIGG